MKISKAIISTMIIGTCLTACGARQEKQPEMEKTPEAYTMLEILKKNTSAKTIYVRSSR